MSSLAPLEKGFASGYARHLQALGGGDGAYDNIIQALSSAAGLLHRQAGLSSA